MPDHLTISDEDATRVITMRRPEKKNAITQDMYREISEAINSAQHNPALRCLVISGGAGGVAAGNPHAAVQKDGPPASDNPRQTHPHKISLCAGA